VIDDRTVSAGQLLDIPVYAGDAGSLEGMQFSLDLGGSLQLVDIKPGVMDVTGDNFGWLRNRTLTSSWNKAEGLDVDEATALFTLVVKAGTSSKLSHAMSLVAGPTEAEAYTVESDIMDIALTFRGIVEQFDFELLQNEPNPFTGITQIGFILPESGEAILTLFDLTGKQVFNQSIMAVKGLNKVEITRDQISAQGMLYYQVQFKGYTATKKMLIL
jgi:hypothetical protein